MEFPEEMGILFLTEVESMMHDLLLNKQANKQNPTHDTVPANGGPMGSFGHAKSKYCELLLN